MTEALFEDFKKRNVHIATVTVATAVAPGSRKAADIASLFWDLHSQTAGKWTW